MPAADTSLLVRLLVRGDARLVEALRRDRLWVSRTVLLETAWVLRGAYGLGPEQVRAGVRALLGLAELEFESAGDVAQALAWAEQGMEFSEALHLAAARDHGGLVGFDAALATLVPRGGA